MEKKKIKGDENNLKKVLKSIRYVSGGGGGELIKNKKYKEKSMGMDGSGGGMIRKKYLGSVDKKKKDKLRRNKKEKEWYEK
jgi:hypothetical protein